MWAYFDNAAVHYGVSWPIQYRLPEAERLSVLKSFGVKGFAPLVYPHKAGMGEWLTAWAMEFGRSTPRAVPTATGVAEYLGAAVEGGARV